MTATLLTAILRDPAQSARLTPDQWTALITAARAEQIVGTLAHRLRGLPMPPAAARILDDARFSAGEGRRAALWEAEVARRALAHLDVPVVLLKGTAFVAGGYKAGQGRSIGDLDILVPRDRIGEVEAALIVAGWEWVKPDPYDDAYYRRWMHELPPLIHRERDRMIDVHHTILPLTARITPDPAAIIADSVVLANGLRVPSPNDMLCHAAAHLFADGDLAGGVRNLWDIHCLLDEFGREGLAERAALHGLTREMARALRLASALYGAGESPSIKQDRHPELVSGSIAQQEQPVVAEPWMLKQVQHDGGAGITAKLGWVDARYRRRLLARDGWGRATRPFTRLAFYIRSHWLRMPPAMLARHLWTKWRKGGMPG